MKTIIAFVAIIIALSSTQYATKVQGPQPVTPTPTSTPAPTPKTKMKWGAYIGREPSLDSFEEKVGKPVDYQAVFVHWGNENGFPQTTLSKDGKTLVIFWEVMDYNVEPTYQPKFSYETIINGSWDDYIKSFAKSAKDYGGPVIITEFEEMNSDWYPWSIGLSQNTGQQHIDAYRHIRELFRGATNVRFAWVVNNDTVPDTVENQFENYYPGDNYVDYVGVDGFNFGDPWQSFHNVFSEALTKLSKYDKPILIFSTASAEGSEKPAWIEDGLGKDIYSYPGVVGWIWFNENKEKDWRVDSSPESLSAFQSVIP